MHAGAVIVPAVLAACERHNPDGAAALRGHRGRRRGDVPAQPGGAEGGAQGGLSPDRGVRRDGRGRRRRGGAAGSTASRPSMRSASPAAWRAASSNISPKARGPSACMPAGRRSRACAPRCWRGQASPARARCSRARTGCSTASRTRSTATTTRSLGDFGQRWVTETLAFKPYPCGTMTHPYIDCARRLCARGIKPDEHVTDIVCDVGEGTVHRLWEPLAAKQTPANGYAGKFSQPYCIADRPRARQRRPRRFHRRGREGPARARALPARSATASIRKIPIRTSSPATSARRSPTAA